MDEVPDTRSIPESTLARMVERVDPDWTLRSATPTERGFCSVYRLVLDDGNEQRTLYLKASPDGERWSIPTEARVLAALDAHTDIPVPEVVGAVDHDDELPTPYYLMTALPGAALDYERVARLDDDALRRLTRETGRHLAALHTVPAVEAFGTVRHDGPTLAGPAPDGDPATLTVADPHEEWASALRSYAETELDRLADSSFADSHATVAPWVLDRIDDLDGPFDPVLCRNDHGLHNLLVDPDTGAVRAALDWGYTLATPAAFDFELAVYIYGGAFFAGLADVEDRRPLVREAALSGYRAVAPERVAAVSSPTPLYQVLAAVRVMNDFGHLDVPDGHESAVREWIAADVRARLEV